MNQQIGHTIIFQKSNNQLGGGPTQTNEDPDRSPEPLGSGESEPTDGSDSTSNTAAETPSTTNSSTSSGKKKKIKYGFCVNYDYFYFSGGILVVVGGAIFVFFHWRASAMDDTDQRKDTISSGITIQASRFAHSSGSVFCRVSKSAN